ncbi:MobA/MobL family protein [Salipiger pacificus]|nr:MobA/MobL family protein [Alloyangia pacifica]
MASYRFSASVISRSTGRSAVAAAAYRAAALLQDDRYGESYDYRPKGGVLHSEIMAPENTPVWMHNREQLWNAVESAERRKDAQLAREIQLSLPHELDDDQRRDLVRSFVAEQFVASGMIADVAIHAPHRQGDQRNHHAHVMLTMRELTSEGFGKKVRDWNDRANIDRWRAEWAEAQNLAFERHGIAASVDHRSLEDQGVDREAQQHEGPNVTAMRRRGEPTRIAEENDRRRGQNGDRADLHAELLEVRQEIDRQRQRFETWASSKRAALEAAQYVSREELEHTQAAATAELKRDLAAYYDPHLRTVEAEALALHTRLEARGFLPSLRRFWTGRADRERLTRLEKIAEETRQQKKQAQEKQEAKHAAETVRFLWLQEQRRQEQHDGIERARERKEDSLSAKLAEAQRRVELEPAHEPEGQDKAELQRIREETERVKAEIEAQERGRDFER